MERYQVILAYDGTHFEGFQRQRKARTVQGVVEAALRCIGWQGRTILAAGRTDTGVHASGQVIAFDLDWNHPPDNLRNALNANLPPDVAARAVWTIHPGFHPRFDAISRRYRYHIFCEPARDPLRERYAWRVWPAASFDLLQKAAANLIGRYDFAAFGTPPRAGSSTTRTVFQAEWFQADAGLSFEITADAFLYHMVRRLVMAQVQIGQGWRHPDELSQALRAGGHPMQGSAPAQGLVLVEVRYPSGAGREIPEIIENVV